MPASAVSLTVDKASSYATYIALMLCGLELASTSSSTSSSLAQGQLIPGQRIVTKKGSVSVSSSALTFLPSPSLHNLCSV